MNGNQVTLVGYVGQHLKAGNTAAGNRRVAVSVATHHIETGNGNKQRKTVWHNVVLWGDTATYAERNFVKGSRIMVYGFIEYRTYMDYSGHKRYITRIKGNSLMNLDR